jgi:CheY-like chemotaxis protein
LTLYAQRGNAAIVIVDSSPNRTRIYEKFFALADLKVVAKFPNASEALPYFESNKSDSIILFDNELIEQPELEVIRRLKDVQPQPKIILVTASDLSEFKLEDKALFDAVIWKPFTLSELMETMHRATTPLRVKGSRIFENHEEIERIFQDILADSNEKMYSVRNPSFVTKGSSVVSHLSSYIAARSKGLKVFLITEITRENLFYCKQLMVNQGVQLRHLDGLRTDFFVWDDKHSVETIRSTSDPSTSEQILYSNLEHIVSKNRYEFEALWSSAVSAEQRISDLEARTQGTQFSVLKGNDAVEVNRTNLVRNAKKYIDACIVPEWLDYLLKPEILKSGIEAISKGVRCRLLTEITQESMLKCKRLIENGVEVRHLPNQKGAFALNEKEVTVNAEAEDPASNTPFSTIYSDYPSFVAQHKSMFSTLWQIATPASTRIRELEIEEEIRNAN